ncbi:MAG: hypothetical protein ACHQQQ_13935 [Bacteroidota bacterium]
MTHYKQLDLRKVKTYSISKRKSKVTLKDFAGVYDPKKDNFSKFVSSLPNILTAKDLNSFVDDILKAHKSRKPVIVFMGAHVVKVGLSPLLIDLMKRNVITCIAMNSAAAIHDVESALMGKTSEDVDSSIQNGTFGMAKETGDFINGRLNEGLMDGTAGYGEVLGKALQKARHANVSILATAYKLKIPVSVHAAIGTDIIHQQPTMSGAATGELSFRDFKVLCNTVKDLRGGGVVMNIGSAVVLPEVFLKAITVVRNLGFKAFRFTTANFDMVQHYRPRMNIVSRPTKNGGKGYMFTGHHEIMIPLLCAMIKNKLGSK